MVIHEMTMEQCLHALADARLARLACSNDNQPYVVPVYLTYYQAGNCLYGFTSPGQKIDWMRTNPLVCVEVDEMTAHDEWVSVVVTGRFEELPEIPGDVGGGLRHQERPRQIVETTPPWSAERHPDQSDDERQRAWNLLQVHPEWWEPCCAAWVARVNRHVNETYTPIYYKIHIDKITGHRATQTP